MDGEKHFLVFFLEVTGNKKEHPKMDQRTENEKWELIEEEGEKRKNMSRSFWAHNDKQRGDSKRNKVSKTFTQEPFFEKASHRGKWQTHFSTRKQGRGDFHVFEKELQTAKKTHKKKKNREKQKREERHEKTHTHTKKPKRKKFKNRERNKKFFSKKNCRR